jgi:hypothetical protein
MSNISAGNSLATATSLTLNPTPLQFVGNQVNVTASASDFYTFRTLGSSSFNFSLKGLTAGGNVNFDLLASDGTTVIRQGNNGGTITDSINLFDQPAGTYYLKVYTTSLTSVSYDLNLQSRDGLRADLLWRNYGTPGESGNTALWTMNGVNPVSRVDLSSIPALSWEIAGTADFNKDGQSDIVWRNYGAPGSNPDAGKVLIWLMNGTSPTQTVYTNFVVADVNWRLEGVADFNGDTNADLVWRNYGAPGSNPDAGKVAIWTMNGVTPVSTVVAPFVVADVNWRLNGVADFNKDGKTDLVWRNYGAQGTGADAGKVAIWTMDGVTPVSTIYTNFVVADVNWRIEGVADFNADNQPDLAWRNYGAPGSNPDAGKVAIWTMNGVTPLQTLFTPFLVSDPNWRLEGTRARYDTPPRIDIDGNSTATAFNIGELNGSGVYRDFVSGPDANDYYTFTVTNAATLTLSLKGLTANADVEILNANGDQVIGGISENPGNTDELIANLGLTAGTYFIRVYSPAGGSTNYEMGLAVTANGVDLRGRSFNIVPAGIALPQPTGSGSVPQPGTFSIEYEIENSGVLASGAFTVRFYLSPDQTFAPPATPPGAGGISGDLLYLGQETINSLLAGQSTGLRTRNVSNLPAADSSYWSSDRTYYIGMIIDDGGGGAASGGEIVEASETNNFNADPLAPTGTVYDGVNITGTLSYDLIGASFAVSNSNVTVTQAGANIDITYTLKNLGRRPFSINQGPISLPITFYLSKDNQIAGGSSDVVLSEEEVILQLGGVNSGTETSGQLTASLFIPRSNNSFWQANGGAGTYYIGMYIDELNLIGENVTGRANNRNVGDAIDRVPITVTFA